MNDTHTQTIADALLLLSLGNDNEIGKDASERLMKLERENATLRKALASAENGLRHGLMMEPVDPFQRGKVISWALDTVRAALKKEAQP